MVARRTVHKSVKIARFDDSNGLKEIVFNNGETISDILGKADITLASGEVVENMSGTEQPLDKKVKNGQSLVVVGHFKSGN